MCSCSTEIVSDSNFFEILLPTVVGGVISAILAVLLFRAGMKKDSDLRKIEANENEIFKKAENKRLWYLNILINPNLEKLNDFFTSLHNHNTSTLAILLQRKANTIKTYQKHKAAQISNFKELILHFESDFLRLVTSSSKGIESDLLDWRLDFEDNILNLYDQILNSDSSKEELTDEIRSIVSQAKSNLYRILYRPLIENN